ncbi:hypothetical protein FQN53_009393 [Emmonsiellopsis sp. PD_33]|nr:hypothetical protein FQN53_009393 [Emmonsiellopsis sp. PD_33]KAK2786416.1 hypothetical protein FQN51_003603 [Onygenales sp. PD_10]
MPPSTLTFTSTLTLLLLLLLLTPTLTTAAGPEPCNPPIVTTFRCQPMDDTTNPNADKTTTKICKDMGGTLTTCGCSDTPGVYCSVAEMSGAVEMQFRNICVAVGGEWRVRDC